MAFNLLAIARSPIDWPMVGGRYRNTDQSFEVFPIVDPENGDAIGISIPTSRFNAKCWKSVSRFLISVGGSCLLDVYVMYQGDAVDIATYVPDGLG
ncbi:hypothetical protein BH11PLA2_BH11PLA2_46330 [soil metagenome]